MHILGHTYPFLSILIVMINKKTWEKYLVCYSVAVPMKLCCGSFVELSRHRMPRASRTQKYKKVRLYKIPVHAGTNI